MFPLLERDCHGGRQHLEQQLVCLLLLNLQLLGLLGQGEGEDLDGEGGVPDQEDDAGGDDDDEAEDGVSQALLLVGGTDLVTDNVADLLPQTGEDQSEQTEREMSRMTSCLLWQSVT